MKKVDRLLPPPGAAPVGLIEEVVHRPPAEVRARGLGDVRRGLGVRVALVLLLVLLLRAVQGRSLLAHRARSRRGRPDLHVPTRAGTVARDQFRDLFRLPGFRRYADRRAVLR